jgi:hypothetical protein
MATETFSKFAGLLNTQNPERFTPADLVTADNVDIDDSGQIFLRDGQALEVAGAAHSVWSNSDHTLALFVAGTGLLRLNADYSTTTLATVTAALRMAYVEVAGRVYFTNGADTGVIANGVARSWGMAVPVSQPTAVAIAGVLHAGRYLYALTYIRSDGQESGTGLSGVIDLPEGSGIRFLLVPPTDPDVVGEIVYVSTENGEVMYLALTLPPSTTSADYLGSGLELALPLRSQWMFQPPPGQVLAHYRGRVLIGAGEFIFPTASLGYEYCDFRDFLALDASRVRVIAPVENGIFVGTAKGVHFLAGESLTAMTRVLRLDAPAVEGTLVYADGAVVTDHALDGYQVPIFCTAAGVVMGKPDGSLENMTTDRYRFNVGTIGAAFFRNDTTVRQYKAYLQS